MLFCSVLYCSGLKRMYAGVMEKLRTLGTARGLDIDHVVEGLKKAHRWHVETA